MTLTIILTFAPSLMILAFVVLSDRFPEPIDMVLSTFFLGFLLCLPAGILNNYLIFSNDTPSDYVYLAGLTEENLKFLALFFFIRKRVEFDEPMDAIVYGTLISLGFATYENYEYVFIYNETLSSLQTAQIRSVTAVPLHAFCGIIMGYNFGIYSTTKSTRYLYQSLAIPVLLHGVYNYLDSLLYTFILITFSLIVCLYLHQSLALKQKEKMFEKEFN